MACVPDTRSVGADLLGFRMGALAVAELVEAHRAYLEGDVLRGVEAVKGLRPR
jgi:hypothetical protein